MRELWALLVKELRQHWGAWLGLLALQAFGLMVLLLGGLFGTYTGVSRIEPLGSYLWLFILPSAVVLGNRLVVAEYHGRTQLFVEALPISRGAPLVVKLGLGTVVLSLGVVLALGIVLLSAWRHEPISAHFVALLASRSLGFTFAWWTFFFAMGFAGRLRVPLYLVLVMVGSALGWATDFELDRFAHFELAAMDQLPYEREVWPTSALIEAGVWSIGWVALAFGLALIHEGSLVESLGRRMSHKEKALSAILGVALLVALAVLDDRRAKPPYEFVETEVVAANTVSLEVAYGRPAQRLLATRLVESLEPRLAALESLLGSDLPVVRVSQHGGLDGSTFDWAELAANDGVLVRANLGAPDWVEERFVAEVVRRVLDEKTHGRADHEPRAWLRDGFAGWWARRVLEGGAADVAPSSSSVSASAPCEDPRWLRALWAFEHGSEGTRALSTTTLAQWYPLREELGEPIAQALAATGVEVLVELAGEDRVEALARATWGRTVHDDLRELVWTWRHPPAKLFSQATEVSLETWLDTWRQRLQRLADTPACQARLADIPQPVLNLDTVEEEGLLRVRVRAERSPGTGATSGEPDRLWVLHERLTPFDHPLDTEDLERLERRWPADQPTLDLELHGIYGRGDRAFFAVETDSAVLGCAVRLLAQRQVLP